MNSSQLSKDNSNNELFENFLKLSKNCKNSNKELKKVKQEKESIIIQLSESHALIDSLKSEYTMLFNTVDSLEIKLKGSEDLLRKFSSENLKSMLCIQRDISNKPGIIVDDLGASTSHASNSEIKSLFIKPLIIDTAYLDNCDNSCFKNCVEPGSNDH
jgi:DNA repair ATPase RecN